VDSALVRMRRRDRLGDRAAAFSQFVQKVFASRRKTLRKALVQGGYNAEAVLAMTKLNAQTRAEELSPERFWEMFQAT
jgi:16S rRNA A1518/A1519 N6-dimethyltransferase RsmA/KsgA/DIM1 with predicted DNA glycosylase/AP lyase activity